MVPEPGIPLPAWAAAKTPGPLHAFYERVRGRRGMQIAVVATARKLAVLCWHLIVKGEDYASARPSLTAQKPPLRARPAWWNPPRRFSSRRAMLRGRGRRQDLAACNVAPQARRRVVISSSGLTSPGSTE